MVLHGVLFFYIISSLYTGVSEPNSEVLMKGVDWDPECPCCLLCALSLFPHPSQRDILKRSSCLIFDHTVFLQCTFILQISNMLQRKHPGSLGCTALSLLKILHITSHAT